MIDTFISSGAGWSALKQSRIASTHDGQCKLTMKQVVVTVVRNGLWFMVVGSVDMVLGYQR